MTNEYKYLEEMNLTELLEAYKEELNLVKDNFPNIRKVSWLSSIDKDTDPAKIRTMRGYLSGLNDCNINIGDLKLILEYFMIERGDN